MDKKTKEVMYKLAEFVRENPELWTNNDVILQAIISEKDVKYKFEVDLSTEPLGMPECQISRAKVYDEFSDFFDGTSDISKGGMRKLIGEASRYKEQVPPSRYSGTVIK